MIKLTLIGGLLALLSLSEVSVADIFLGMMGLGAAFFVLAVVLERVGVVLESFGRWTDNAQRDYAREMQRSPRSPI